MEMDNQVQFINQGEQEIYTDVDETGQR